MAVLENSALEGSSCCCISPDRCAIGRLGWDSCWFRTSDEIAEIVDVALCIDCCQSAEAAPKGEDMESEIHIRIIDNFFKYR